MSNKVLILTFMSKIKKIVEDTEKKVKELETNKSLKEPINFDIINSEKVNAYEEILKGYKKYLKEKNSEK